MGWLGSSKQTVKNVTEVPAWVEQTIQQGVGAAANYQSQPFVPYTNSRVAGLDPLQSDAASLAAQLPSLWRPIMDQATSAAAAGGASARTVTAPAITAPGVSPTAAAGSKTAADFMGAYQNPWLDGVLRGTLDAIDERAGKTHSDLGLKLANANAYGGSREAIMRAEIERAAMKERGVATSDVLARGFETAANLGAQDANLWGSASQFNAGAANDMEKFNSQMKLDSEQVRGLFDLQAQTANQTADENLARRQLESASIFGNLADQAQRGGAADATLLNLFGAQGREVSQQQLDAMYEEFLRAQDDPVRKLQLLLSATSGAPFDLFKSTTSSSTSKDPARDLAAIGSFLQGVGGMFG